MSTPRSWFSRKTVTDEDPRYMLAAVTAIKHELEIPKSMRAEKFTIKESENPTFQQHVCRIKNDLKEQLESKLKQNLKINLLDLLDKEADDKAGDAPPVASVVIVVPFLL